MRIVRRVDLDRFREELKNAREGRGPLRSGPKMGRPALSKLTANGHGKPVHSQTITNIEDGRIKDPGLVTVARMVEAMGLTLSDFFARIEGLPPTRQSDLESRSPGSEADHGAALSADAYVQQQFVVAVVHELAAAIDRLVATRTENKPTRGTQPALARSAGKTRRSTAR